MHLRKKSTIEVLEKVRDDFVQGRWWHGNRGFHGYYCLVGAIGHELEHNQFSSSRAVQGVLNEMGLGFQSAYRLNDSRGRRAVIKRIDQTLARLRMEVDPYEYLHRALDQSRVAHAQRDLGKKVPDLIPAAWTEQVPSVELVEA